MEIEAAVVPHGPFGNGLQVLLQVEGSLSEMIDEGVFDVLVSLLQLSVVLFDLLKLSFVFFRDH